MKREGIVEWYKEEEGYGRILLEGEEVHVFVHFSSILLDKDRFPDHFRYLRQKQKVTFDLIETSTTGEQKYVAENVMIISD
ncbi:cold-shock protein [Lysinibacillus pakistanensis]|uniref:Cold shock domain-containing protein n=1 Tax=Lysinibacillus pakistanensis TaxID=759811 RepID=A0AAX3X4A5_9BACI|nr:cold shock domain-containing protein [Lysinibacillus pakistanensis]MDM5233157.1 cold shock domain-containing protein [Lysinibacillus pakistanensis]WHY48637.1 cold shock domain-containing protein [Lysinibacillus pakistanensis]WHY53651.1 cold shock domain-containing protein [Lysinibacillus pakistanensis]